MLSLVRLRLFALPAESVVLPLVREGKTHPRIDTCQDRRMLPPNNIPSAVSLLPTDSKEAAKTHSHSNLAAEQHVDSLITSQDKAFKSAWPSPHERGQQQALSAHGGYRHHAVPALEAALQGADINKIRDGVPLSANADVSGVSGVRVVGLAPQSPCRRGGPVLRIAAIRAQPILRKLNCNLNIPMLLSRL